MLFNNPMAGNNGNLEVSFKTEVKNVFDKTLTSGLIETMNKKMAEAVKGSSKLALVPKVTNGFLLTVSLLSLTRDEKKKPIEVKAQIKITAIAVGGTAKGFIAGPTGGSADSGNPDKKAIAGRANQVVGDIIESMMTKAVDTMAKLAK